MTLFNFLLRLPQFSFILCGESKPLSSIFTGRGRLGTLRSYHRWGVQGPVGSSRTLWVPWTDCPRRLRVTDVDLSVPPAWSPSARALPVVPWFPSPTNLSSPWPTAPPGEFSSAGGAGLRVGSSYRLLRVRGRGNRSTLGRADNGDR